MVRGLGLVHGSAEDYGEYNLKLFDDAKKHLAEVMDSFW